MEKNTKKLKIAGEEYFVTSEEAPEYMESLAREIDAKMGNLLKNSNLSTTQAAVLAALDFADAAKKSTSTTDNLRAQLKDYLEDAAKAKSERDFYKRELDKTKAAKKVEGGDKGSSSLWG